MEMKLYIWPRLWDLPSFDPYCLAAVLYLQLAIPGKFGVVECTDPDLSPSGQLPFLVHGPEVITSFSSIVRYVAGLASSDESSKYPHANVDSFLSTSDRSQRNAWLAYAEADLGDLVASAMYASLDNWENLTLPELASLFPTPQRYFVPQKLRAAYHPRLQNVGLWPQTTDPAEEEKKKTPFEKEMRQKAPKLDKKRVQQMFSKEKLVAKAKPILDIYVRLLGENRYIFENKISSLDLTLASRILLLTAPPYPDPTFKSLLETSYPTLVVHAQHVHERILGSNALPIKFEPHTRSLWDLLPIGRPFSFQQTFSRKHLAKPVEKSDEDKHVDKMRWGFVGLVLGSLCAYVAVVGFSMGNLQIGVVPKGQADDDEDDEDEDEDDDDEEEEDEE